MGVTSYIKITMNKPNIEITLNTCIKLYFRDNHMANNVNWEIIALRRAAFLIEEACSLDPTYDQTVSSALRVISNWATVRTNGASSFIKWHNRKISKAAWELYFRSSDKEWERGTINEHQEPISQVWKWIIDNKESISPRDILNRMEKWPMITITKAEDAAISNSGRRSIGLPEERHLLIDIGDVGPPKRRTGKN